VAFAGHSLGQVTALIASGVFAFDDGIRFAARRAAVTRDAAVARPGSMAALLGASTEDAAAAVAAAPETCWIANDNAPGQIVIAGTADGVAAASAAAKDLGVRRVTALDVAAAFHTPLMASAAEALTADAPALVLSKPSAPVVSNEDAVAYADADGWRTRLPAHVVRPVRWRESMLTIAGLGATSFVEVGPSATLTALAKRCTPELTAAAS
jgi:[acyl-carrier-protein] S-malonyltransferase